MASTTVDFDLHGLVGLRLLDPGQADVAAVKRQTGLEPAPLGREPDLTIRFTDRLDVPRALRLLGLDDAAYGDGHYLVMRDRGARPTFLHIPFERAAPGWTLGCERGRSRIPLLVPLLNLTALARDVLPLHASAFELGGTGVLVTGWAKGGKTETLLGFMADGATHVGDEWVYLPGGGRDLYGIPEPMRVWDWHLHALPQVRARLAARDRLRLRATSLAAASVSALAHLPGGAGAVLGRVAALAHRQRFVHVSPADLFGSAACRMRGRADVVLLVESHDDPATTVTEIDPATVAQRMPASLAVERLPLWLAYEQFRFALPGLRCELLESAPDVEARLLARSLDGLPAYLVAHPYPADVPALVRAARSVL